MTISELNKLSDNDKARLQHYTRVAYSKLVKKVTQEAAIDAVHRTMPEPQAQAEVNASAEFRNQPDAAAQVRRPVNVGIIGGGIAGMYTALMLMAQNNTPGSEQPWYNFHIYEANDRVGGRIYTHRFSNEPNQYFEAGAMRIPNLPFQKVLKDLIKWLNTQVPKKLNGDDAVQLVPYTLSEPKNNFVYVNQIGPMAMGEAQPDKLAPGQTIPDLGFGKRFTQTASNIIYGVTKTHIDELKKRIDIYDQDRKPFDEYFKYLYDNYDSKSMHEVLIDMGFDTETINYIEVMTTQTNQLKLSYLDNLMMNIDFGTNELWETIKDGMDTLPNAMLHVLGYKNFSLGARVIEVTPEKVIKYTKAGCDQVFSSEAYDKILFALPPNSVRMIKTPKFSIVKEAAIRSLNFEPLHKIGVQFKTKFWKKGKFPVDQGGQSITDLPSRWIVYPSYGNSQAEINEPGVILLYAWNTDAQNFVRLTEEERIAIALRDLQTVYPDVDIKEQFMAAKSVNWVETWSGGDALFQPSQFSAFWQIAQTDENGFYFAGEHLSQFHTWIAGAIHSSLTVCAQMFGTTTPVVPIGEKVAEQTFFDQHFQKRRAIDQKAVANIAAKFIHSLQNKKRKAEADPESVVRPAKIH